MSQFANTNLRASETLRKIARNTARRENEFIENLAGELIKAGYADAAAVLLKLKREIS